MLLYCICFGGRSPPKQNQARTKAAPNGRNRPRTTDGTTTRREPARHDRTRHPSRREHQATQPQPTGTEQGEKQTHGQRKQRARDTKDEKHPATDSERPRREPSARHQRQAQRAEHADTNGDTPAEAKRTDSGSKRKTKTGKQHEEHPQRRSWTATNPKEPPPATPKRDTTATPPPTTEDTPTLRRAFGKTATERNGGKKGNRERTQRERNAPTPALARGQKNAEKTNR